MWLLQRVPHDLLAGGTGNLSSIIPSIRPLRFNKRIVFGDRRHDDGQPSTPWLRYFMELGHGVIQYRFVFNIEFGDKNLIVTAVLNQKDGLEIAKK